MAAILSTREGAVARLVISNTARRNAMTLSMWQSLAAALKELDDDEDVRVVVLSGEGEQAFVSGADISEFDQQRSGMEAVRAYDEAVMSAQFALSRSSKITLASVRGVCFGGGLGLLLACDLRYACDTARFRMPAARLGLGYRREGMLQMVQAIGASRAAELFYTARVFDGVEAQRLGVVHQCFAEAAFAESVARLVGDIAQNAPLSLRAVKLAIRDIQADEGDRDEQAVRRAVERCFASEDYQEGRRAFMEKRPPVFRGR